MSVFLGVMFFIMGTVFGSFFTLAVYRIPLGKDITHERSFCTNCNHRLEFLDLIPIWSYVFLKGKCRYCGEKVRIRYLILEVLSGTVFLMAYLSLNIKDIVFELYKMVFFVEFAFFYVTLVLIAGIDKEYRKINLSILLFGGMCEIIYILYLYIVDSANVHRYSIYGLFFIILWIIVKLVEKKRDLYILEILVLLSYIIFVVGVKAIVFIVPISIVFWFLLYLKNKEKYNKLSRIPIGFMLSFSTIVYKIVENFIGFY